MSDESSIKYPLTDYYLSPKSYDRIVNETLREGLKTNMPEGCHLRIVGGVIVTFEHHEVTNCGGGYFAI